jgi:hypothetical protein
VVVTNAFPISDLPFYDTGRSHEAERAGSGSLCQQPREWDHIVGGDGQREALPTRLTPWNFVCLVPAADFDQPNTSSMRLRMRWLIS